MGTSPVDALDRSVVYHLQEDGRRPITEIADALDVADNTVRNRIRALEDEGIIEGYSVDIDYDGMGVPHHYLFVCSAPVSRREQLAGEARGRDGVVDVTVLVTGRCTVLVSAVGSGTDRIAELARGLDELGLTVEREHLVRDRTRLPFDGFRLDL